MSTILDALQKSRKEPPPPGVEARPEILDSMAHNYLATTPGRDGDPIAFLRRLLYGAACIIFLLVALVGLLALRSFRQASPATVDTAVAAANSAPEPSTMAVAVPPVETPAPTPELTPQPTPEPTPLPTPEPTPTPAPSAPSASESGLTERAAEVSEEDLAERAVRAFRSSVRIDGIIWDRESPMAMVNGRTVSPGSSVAGGRVLEIHRNSIVFEVQGRRTTLHH